MERDVKIRGDMIRLGQLLKLAGLIDAGGQAAAFLATTPVRVNGEPEERRGRQLRRTPTLADGAWESLVGARPLRVTPLRVFNTGAEYATVRRRPFFQGGTGAIFDFLWTWRSRFY